MEAAERFQHVPVAGAHTGAGIARVAAASGKPAFFHRADEALPAEANLASNTSSIPITSLGGATARPDRAIGTRFFNPAPVMGLVEIVRAHETSDGTAAAIVGLATELGKRAAETSGVPRLVANHLTEVLHEGHGDPYFAPESQ